MRYGSATLGRKGSGIPSGISSGIPSLSSGIPKWSSPAKGDGTPDIMTRSTLVRQRVSLGFIFWFFLLTFGYIGDGVLSLKGLVF